VEFVDIALGIVAVLILYWLLGRVIAAARRGRAARVPRPRRRDPRIRPTYEFEPVTDRLYRRVKGVSGPAEDRQAILNFIGSRSGVEAYVEPKTVMHPLSVVLVAGDGEWKRFELPDDAFIRDLARSRGVPVLDAARTGYPPRMRRHRPPSPPAGDAGPAEDPPTDGGDSAS
jgi:hypothetical protein